MSGKITVGLGARAYDIEIGEGLLDRAGALIAPLLNRPYTVVVTDENVAAAQGARLKAGLDAQTIAAEWIVLAPGEGMKSFAGLEALAARLIDLGVERDDVIVAFGGGVIGDLAGFAAAVLRRGCRYAQIPTTLLAQVDSAVGGKTAINLPQGKNLVGAFHQPALVIADAGALTTLPARELRAGYAEIVKYAALGDADFFAWLEQNGAALLAGDQDAVRHAVRTCCAMKAAIVAADERESGRRALLNLGHTFAHALEGVLGPGDALLHGEAVAAGMSLAFDYSARTGAAPAGEAERLKAHLKRAGLPVGFADIPAARALTGAALVDLMRQDKKVAGGRLTLILARRIGDAFIAKDASFDDLAAFLDERMATQRR